MPRRQQSILIVEDQLDQRKRLASLVRKLFPEVKVATARSAAEAVKKFDQTPSDLLLLDLSLGDGPDGLSLLRALRNCPQPFRVVAITAHPREYAARISQSALDAVLEKPYTGEDLVAIVGEQLALGRKSMSLAQKRLAFCAVPFASSFADTYSFGIKAAAERAGYRCLKMDEEAFTTDILAEIQKRIRRADLVIGDVSGNNPNVCYEVGYAHALKKPVVLLVDSAAGLFFDIRNLRHIVYGQDIKGLRDDLQAMLEKLKLPAPPKPRGAGR